MVTPAPAMRAELPSIPEIGALFDDKFRIDGVLGQGGMAIVLAATHLQLEHRVAIKVLLPASAEDPDVVARFLREGRSASKIRSEHVARVLDVGMDGERPYIVMEHLDGVDLDAVLVESGPLPTVLAVDYLLQACEAIAEAHVGGVIHRDLKPSNLFLTHRADGAACVKVLDFGISKLLQRPNSVTLAHETSPLLIMGTPHYMSPEQMQSARSVDQRSDLWSLGAILHELVAGKPPFQGESITALCAAILMEAPPPLSSRHGDVPPALSAVVRRCLEKDPANRFANIAELAAALAPLGSEAAQASATYIERVLEGASDTAPGVRPEIPRPELPTAASMLASGPRGLAARVLGPVAVIGLVILALALIGWGIARGPRAADAEALPQAPEVSHAIAPLPPPPVTPASAAASIAPPRALHAPPRHKGSGAASSDAAAENPY